MAIHHKLIVLLGLSMLLAGCSTGMGGGSTASDKGMQYLLGRGVPQSDVKAFEYFKKAADEGDPFAENEIAYLYATGKGTPRDKTKAFLYYQKAAQKGLVSAEYNLGLMYLHGIGTPPNRALAMQWFRKSAGRGFEPAKQALSES